MNTHPQTLPAGSTLILSTTSPDKRQEYHALFQRYDINFIFLEDLGLSPQKTDEMTNTYEGNLLQKAAEVSLALHHNLTAIHDRLGSVGYDLEQPILGMVEDSGIEVFPAMEAESIQQAFHQQFKKNIDDRIYNEFLVNRALRSQVFPGMDADELLDALANMEANNVWMTRLSGQTGFPGPNYKPIYEALPGGVREFYDILDSTIRDVLIQAGHPKDAANEEKSLLRFTNRCQIMLVEPHANPLQILDAANIIEGISYGDVVSSSVAQSLIDYRQNLHKVKHQLGRLFTADYIQPDGRKFSKDTQRRLIEDRGLLTSESGEVADYYRLDAVNQIEQKYQLPRAEKESNTRHYHNSDGVAKTKEEVTYHYQKRLLHQTSPRLLILYSGSEPPASLEPLHHLFQEKGFTILPMYREEELLTNPHARVMQQADMVVILPGKTASPLEHAELVLAASVDKQVMPSAKETSLITINTQFENGESALDGVLKLLRHKKYTGLKNGISEINHVASYDRTIETLIKELEPLIERELKRKQYRLSDIQPIQPPQNMPESNLPHIDTDSRFTVFVAGGAANEYTGFKAPSNQLGRFIHDQGWVLVTGAGQKEGPMGAVHSGFVEAYLHRKLSAETLTAEERGQLYDALKRWAAQNTTRRNLRAEAALHHQTRIVEMIMGVLDQKSGKLIERPNINAEFLAHEAPEILQRLLEPSEGSLVEKTIGSLKASGGMIGYSMPPLLISEGSGDWPVGMQGYNAGNMQRRMARMLESTAHVFLAGGQGTDQELLRSVGEAIDAVKAGSKQIKPILILEQPVYKDGVYHGGEGTVFKPALEIIEQTLEKEGLTAKSIGLKTYGNMRLLEAELERYYKEEWGK
jgi:predicted Rossmann-fold nucleotide-binding protein